MEIEMKLTVRIFFSNFLSVWVSEQNNLLALCTSVWCCLLVVCPLREQRNCYYYQVMEFFFSSNSRGLQFARVPQAATFSLCVQNKCVCCMKHIYSLQCGTLLYTWWSLRAPTAGVTPLTMERITFTILLSIGCIRLFTLSCLSFTYS